MSSFQGSHGGRHAEDCAPLQQLSEQMCAVFIRAILDNSLRYPTKSGVSDDNWEKLKGMQMVKRQGNADDIANLGVFLASDEGSFINDQVILCDGGNQMRGFRV